jgi:branched-chain amino acid transport system ATP-binding protein
MAERLVIDHLVAGYGEAIVLDDLSLVVEPGQTMALLGRNGVGKTTLLATLAGRTTVHSGSIRYGDADVLAARSYRRIGMGIGLVPQEREIFPSLRVEENLRIACRPGRWTMEAMYAMFPSLAKRQRNYGNELSGGEQQMLAIARALVGNPTLLLLDEPLEGLAPVIVDALMEVLQGLKREGGMSILLVEQHAHLALQFADTAVVLDRGKVVFNGAASALAHDDAQMRNLLGVAA